MEPTKTEFTREEVSKHNTQDDCWIIIDSNVYNLTEYWRVHPGGGHYILKYAGQDATQPFREYNHTPFAM
jgi:cytochrome b involved in lipid metabolism